MLMAVGVDKAAAEARRGELIDILRSYPDPAGWRVGRPISRSGLRSAARTPRYGSTRSERRWGYGNTPAKLRLAGSEALQLARNGFVMITGSTVKNG